LSRASLPDREILYGVYDSRLYVIVYNRDRIGWQEADAVAKQCGSRFATITSHGENMFIASLAHTDVRLLNIQNRWDLGSGSISFPADGSHVEAGGG